RSCGLALISCRPPPHTSVTLFFASSRAHRDLHSFPTRRSSDLCPRIHHLHANQHRHGIKSRPKTRGNSRCPSVIGSWNAKWHWGDRKSTRLNSSHVKISYAVFCLKKKKKNKIKGDDTTQPKRKK